MAASGRSETSSTQSASLSTRAAASERHAATLADARRAAERAVENLARLQGDDGAWPGDYGGPMFLLPMYIALCRASGRTEAIGDRRRGRMVAHFFAVQKEDGSIGLHAEDARGSMFTTTLVYVALRALGALPDEPRMVRMRRWIHENGTPLGAASWGKLTLCLLHLYEWDGIHPVLPELWLLPPSAPVHPGRLWCHCRQVYLPMAWLYGTRSRAAVSQWTLALREELYDGAWASLDWKAQRGVCSPADAYRPDSRLLQAANRAMGAYEQRHLPFVRRRALASVLEHVRYEDEVTGFVDIGPVNKVLNAFVHFFRIDAAGAEGDPTSGPSARADFERAFARCDDYLWDAEDGTTKMQGYNNSKLWDTAFAIQAILASQSSLTSPAVAAPVLERAHGYLRDNQIVDDVPDAAAHFRHASRGGWPFSTREHGWPITDCTSEGLKCALALEGRYWPAIPRELIEASVHLILSWQNDDGGWATYEKQRGGAWLERLNPSQVFGDIMVDYSYVECTSACLQAIARARSRHDGAIRSAMDSAIARGADFLRAQQRKDGSFEGKWAVCFTYGTWFAVSGLLAAGVAKNDEAVARACAFLLAKQRADGGWGEHGASCREGRYVEAERAGVTQTSWALSTLVRADHPSRAAQERAARLLVSRQEVDGSWAKEPLVGVFNKTCLIDYDNYRHYFPLWALAEWSASSTMR